MRKILIIKDGLREIIEVGNGGGVAIDSDTGLPVNEILWDEGEMAEVIPPEIIDNLDGAVVNEIDVPDGTEPVLDEEGNPTFDEDGEPITVPKTRKKKILEIDETLRAQNIELRRALIAAERQEQFSKKKQEAKNSVDSDARFVATIKVLLKELNVLQKKVGNPETKMVDLRASINDMIDRMTE